MKDPVKESIFSLLDRLKADLETLAAEQLAQRNAKGWRTAVAAAQNVALLSKKIAGL